MKNKFVLVTLLTAICWSGLNAQYDSRDSTYHRFFLGSTAFLLGNFAERNSPDFVQLNFGYRLSEKDVISLEIKTWKYAWPLGIPIFSDSYEADGENFPGYIRERGFALVYQRFLWKGLYAGLHSMNAWQKFVGETGGKIGDGFQIFNTYRLGYHLKLFRNRFFVEPSLAITHRAYHTEMPESFKVVDDRWSKFLYGEPGLHFGFNF
ncbi:hypothetical protein CEQ90_19120 [Lewinellaceae bacterium SD302]|nr:hypothetical protein CEQ90_19120 [Lewinellaceae bacterium SD302]